MAYDIQCRTCKQHTWARNIVDLVSEHVAASGRFVCQHCESTDTFIYRENRLQEEGETWVRWIKGVIQLDSGIETYSPYIFLVAEREDGEPNGLHFNYYKDTRAYPNGRLKHGHGPGGAPLIDIGHLYDIIQRLVSMRLISKRDVELFAETLNE